MSHSSIDRFAAWTSALRVQDVPARVTAKARLQLLSVLAASYAGLGTAAGRTLLDVLRRRGAGGSTDVLFPPTGERMRTAEAVLAGAALGMTLDYDDYLWLGHTGHSAVWASLCVAAQEGRTVAEARTAQVAANEVAGRLGGLVVVGPQNGQLWSHVHLGGAAVAAARLRGLDAERTADALGIALYQPPFALWPGFLGSESKILTAALPSWQALLAVDLAAAGMAGARDLVDHERGLGRFFAYAPAPHMLGGLGAAWVSDTLAYKLYPGCAYVDAAVDAAHEVLRQRAGGGPTAPLAAADVRAVRVRAGAMTAGMEALSAPHRARDAAAPLTPVEVNFSVALSVAMTLCRGGLRAADFAETSLRAVSADVRALAARTDVEHDLAMTLDLLDGLDRALALRRFVAALGPRALWRAARRLQDDLSLGQALRPRLGAGSVGAVARALWTGVLGGGGRRKAHDGGTGGDAGPYDFGRAQLDVLEFRFSAAVEVELQDGTVLQATQRIPRAAPGWDAADTERLVHEKFLREAAPVLGEARARAALAAATDPAGDARPASALLADLSARE